MKHLLTLSPFFAACTIIMLTFQTDISNAQATMTYTPLSNTNTVNSITIPASSCYSTVSFSAQCWGGGGAGGGGSNKIVIIPPSATIGAGGGGSGGGFAGGTVSVPTSSTVSTTVYYYIGAGGTAVSNNNGNPGNSTWFSTVNSASGIYNIEATGGFGGGNGNHASGTGASSVGSYVFGASVTGQSHFAGGTGANEVIVPPAMVGAVEEERVLARMAITVLQIVLWVVAVAMVVTTLVVQVTASARVLALEFTQEVTAVMGVEVPVEVAQHLPIAQEGGAVLLVAVAAVVMPLLLINLAGPEVMGRSQSHMYSLHLLLLVFQQE